MGGPRGKFIKIHGRAEREVYYNTWEDLEGSLLQYMGGPRGKFIKIHGRTEREVY